MSPADQALRRTLHAMLASATCPASGEERAWVEARLRAPVWPARMRQRLLTLALRWSQDNDRQHELALRQTMGETMAPAAPDPLPMRAWKQLRAAAEVPGNHDQVLRMVLAAMAADMESGLTPVQRQWILDLGVRRTPLTAHERARLRPAVMSWVETRMPGCGQLVEKQFDIEHG
jgi:hypothetical protein